VSKNPALQSLDVGYTGITSLNVDNNPDLLYLDVGYTDISALDVSKNTKLQQLSVNGTGISSLNVDSNPDLLYLDVDGSRLPLSQLYPMTLPSVLPNLISLALGIQTEVALPAISADPIPGQGYNLASEAFLGGRNTVFSLTIDSLPAVSGSDYSINGAGVLTFLERGEYRITMQNDAVRSNDSYYGFGTDMAAVITAPISVLPAGSRIFWDGSSSPVWVPVSSGAAGKNWHISGFPIRYLESDEAVFGPEGTKEVRIDPAGVSPGTMEVTAGGYAFSGGQINGRSLTLAAPADSAAVFRNRIDFSSGIAVNSGNSLVFDCRLADWPAGAAIGAAIAGAGSAVKAGDGVLTLTGAKSYTGSTQVREGSFLLGTGADISRSLEGGGLIFSGGARFGFSGLGSSLPVPKLAVTGGIRPASIDPGSYAADLRGADLSWLVPPSARN
jgi:autotransporter-associated beta strand protein